MNRIELLLHLKQQGFDTGIIQAFAKVRRERFVPARLKEVAYEDCALPLDFAGSTISQPSTIAFMLSLLDVQEGQRTLEIGSGCGYVLALLAELVGKTGKVYGIEIDKQLAHRSKKLLNAYANVSVTHGNGFRGLPRHAPFNRIIVSAAAREKPWHLLGQLQEPGVLVAPVCNTLVQLTKRDEKVDENNVPGFVFVPLREN